MLYYLFLHFKKAYCSVRREILHNIFIEFSTCMKLVRLIKMCENETCNKVHKSELLSVAFPVQNNMNDMSVH
jgi:hypothetical protein